MAVGAFRAGERLSAWSPSGTGVASRAGRRDRDSSEAPSGGAGTQSLAVESRRAWVTLFLA